MNKISNQQHLSKNIDPKGLIIAGTIILLWVFSLVFLLGYSLDFSNPVVYLAILVQTHLYTGLFITAHDAMHGVVSSNRKLNHAIGWLAALLFSYNFYWKLFPNHHKHHRHVATDQDPDYHASNRFFPWYMSFLFSYLNIWQFLLMAGTFNLLKVWIPTENLIVFWMLPAILSTLQLFYFGTYLPHRGEHTNPHHSGTLAPNHIWAFISCYFFGYHYEHHDSPNTPWWRLWRAKNAHT